MTARRFIIAFCFLFALGGGSVAYGQPTFSKAASPSTIGPGSASVLRYTISNNTGAPAESMAFSETLPAGVTIATPSMMISDCMDALISGPDGGTTLSLSGARLGTGASCLVEINITSSVAAVHTMTSGNLTSSAGSSGTSSADLTVNATRLGFSASYAPGTVACWWSPSGAYAARNRQRRRRIQR